MFAALPPTELPPVADSSALLQALPKLPNVINEQTMSERFDNGIGIERAMQPSHRSPIAGIVEENQRYGDQALHARVEQILRRRTSAHKRNEPRVAFGEAGLIGSRPDGGRAASC